MSRLKLNWSLQWRDERNQFAKEYLNSLSFIPNESELDMIGKYILWGKDRLTNLNASQEGIELETAHKTWNRQPYTSLDALLESDTFTESDLRRPELPPYKIPRQAFSREEARKLASPSLLLELESLWYKIDETELITSLYDLSHNRRTLPIRQSLIERFTNLPELEQKAQSLSQPKYLALRRLLVELREQQFLYKDGYNPSLISTPTWNALDLSDFTPEDFSSYPISPFISKPLYKSIVHKDNFPSPKDLNEENLQKELTDFLWKPRQINEIDFTNADHLYWLINARAEESQLFKPFFEILDMFINLTNLKDYQKDILNFKIEHLSNKEISEKIEAKYNKKYSLNYISTLFHKSILEAIAQTAKKYREVLENLFFSENFKTCADCGKSLLLDSDNFVKSARARDGFECRCKQCAKEKRNKKKESK